MTVRLAKVSDALELKKLNNLFNGVGCNGVEAIKLFLENNNQEIICVAEEENKLVGFCCGQIFKSMCYKNSQGEITELYVLKNYRRQGVAKKLIEFMESEFIKKGVCDIRVLTGEDNIIAREFYTSCQYEETDEMMLEKCFN